MTTFLEPLPPDPVDFDRPPVGEVALAVQLAEPATDDAITLGRFWPQVQDRYPHVESQPPLPPMNEEFSASAVPTVSFQLLDRPPSGRYWLLNDDETELIQVQPDRFAYNWRREPSAAEYPRYRHLRERFHEVFSTFVATARQRGGKDVRPTWCEVTYVNPIDMPGDEDRHLDLSRILRRISPAVATALPDPEDTSLAERYVLRRDGEPFGRMHVTATPAYSVRDQRPIYLVTLVARGLARTPDVAGAIEFFDHGRALIVNIFKDMTTEEMHARWGINDAC